MTITKRIGGTPSGGKTERISGRPVGGVTPVIDSFRLLLEGDAQETGSDMVLLEGDMQSGDDLLKLEGDEARVIASNITRRTQA